LHDQPDVKQKDAESMSEQIIKNIAVIKERIHSTCTESGRNPNEVKLNGMKEQ